MTDKQVKMIMTAFRDVFISPNEMDSNSETANVVDGLYYIGRSIHYLAGEVEKLKEELQARR